MALHVYQCESVADVAAYVAEHAIAQAAIQAIVCDSSGRWALLWWA